MVKDYGMFCVCVCVFVCVFRLVLCVSQCLRKICSGPNVHVCLNKTTTTTSTKQCNFLELCVCEGVFLGSVCNF